MLYRDKCTRGFSEFQYFTKEILLEIPELVGHFPVLDLPSLRLTEGCKSNSESNPMKMNNLSQRRVIATFLRANFV